MKEVTQRMKEVREIVGDTRKYIDTLECWEHPSGTVAFVLSEETIPLDGREGYKLQTVCRALNHEQTRELYEVLREVVEAYDETA